jgi:hypothetical protein
MDQSTDNLRASDEGSGLRDVKFGAGGLLLMSGLAILLAIIF